MKEIVQGRESKNLKDNKDTIRELHKNNRDDVPKYLDNLKIEKKIQIKEATYDNDFLKYML